MINSQKKSFVLNAHHEFTELIHDMKGDYNASAKKLKKSTQLLSTQQGLIENYNVISALTNKINAPLGTAVLAVSSVNDKIAEVLSKKSTNLSEHFTQITSLQNELDIAHQRLIEINSLIEQLNDLKPESKLVKVSSFSLKDSIKHIVKHTEKIIQGHNFSVQMNIDPEYYIETCQSVFQRVIVGLIYNLCLYSESPEKSNVIHIKVIPTLHNDSFVILIEDSTKEMSEETLDKAFDPFLHLNEEHSIMGFGLVAISNLVINTLNGTIDVDNHHGGTVFKVVIPIHRVAPIDCNTCTLDCHK